MDERYMFAVWRFNHLWQAVSRKGQGRRMGGGKGPIDHYVFPFRAERVVLEMGGRCELVEVYDVLKAIQKKLGFRTRIITHDSVRKREEKEKWVEENNMNPFTFKFCVQNNVLGCSKYLNRYDYMWFGKYL
ncbi:39S ribosomal protein L16 mitochondrial [Biomphalaria glabrata]